MWQLFLVSYFALGTAGSLMRRVLAERFHHHNKLINAILYVFFLLPIGIVLAQFFPHNLNVGTTNLVLLLGGAIVWPLFNITAFRANKNVDAGVYTLISNLSPLFTLALAIPFLGERLSPVQYAGIGILIVSGVIATLPHMRKDDRAVVQGLLFCLLSTALLGIGTAYERFMLDRIDFGAYLILGWGSQVVWMALLAGREWKLFPELVKSVGARTLLLYGLVNGLKSASFILTLLFTSASLLSGAGDFMPIGIIIGAYFFLNERDHILRKSIATVIGIAGLILLTI